MTVNLEDVLIYYQKIYQMLETEKHQASEMFKDAMLDEYRKTLQQESDKLLVQIEQIKKIIVSKE